MGANCEAYTEDYLPPGQSYVLVLREHWLKLQDNNGFTIRSLKD